MRLDTIWHVNDMLLAWAEAAMKVRGWCATLQGTNAHIVLESQQYSAVPAAAARVPWQRRRFWVASPAHALLQSFAAGGHGVRFACFELTLRQPRLAALSDHQVRLPALCGWENKLGT